MKRNPGKAAFSLVEVAFAVGVASFCLITLLALIPVGVGANQSSVEQTVATGLMAAVVADLRSTSQPTSSLAASVASPRYGITIPRASATAATSTSFFLTLDGNLCGTTLNTDANPAQNPHYRVLLNFYPPLSITGLTASSGQSATRVRILITWPAMADPHVSNSPSNFTGSVETVVELNRNWQDH